MSNIIRGFRSIGWVLTVPGAALLILVFFEGTRDFSPTDYAVERTPAGWIPDDPGNVIEMPNLGYAEFSRDVPLDVAGKVISDFSKNPDKNIEHGPWENYQKETYLDANGNPIPTRWGFTVRRRSTN